MSEEALRAELAALREELRAREREVASLKEQLARLTAERDRTREDIKRDPLVRAITLGRKLAQLDPQGEARRLERNMERNRYWRQEAERRSEDIPLILDWLKRYQDALQKELPRARLMLEGDTRAGQKSPPEGEHHDASQGADT